MATPEQVEAFQKFCFPRPEGSGEPKIERRPLTEQQTKVYNLASVGWAPGQISERMNIPVASVYDALSKIKHWGYHL